MHFELRSNRMVDQKNRANYPTRARVERSNAKYDRQQKGGDKVRTSIRVAEGTMDDRVSAGRNLWPAPRWHLEVRGGCVYAAEEARRERTVCQNRLSARINVHGYVMEDGRTRCRGRQSRKQRAKEEEGSEWSSESLRVARWPVHYHNRIPLCGS